MTNPGTAMSLLARLRTALADGEPVRLDLTGAARPAPAPPGTAVVVRTSGSTTGTGRSVALAAAALRHSATATHERLGGPGQWLLAVPGAHIAGLQVLVRSILAGHDPVVLAPGHFDPRALARAIDSMRDDVPRYLSLVPTQLHRAMTAGPQVRAALATCSAILVGGAALPPVLLREATGAEIRVVRTYGMTETSGGCVYDGVPLNGVQVRIEEGRVLIAGPVLATGYLGEEPGQDDPFVLAGGVRWLRTPDAGTLTEGRLRVLGRLDDVIVTGGVNVHPGPIERVLSTWAHGTEVAVVGVDDPQWGQLVTAVLHGPGPQAPDLAEIRSVVAAELGSGPQVPRAAVALDEVPLRGPGKVDRRAVARRAAAALARGAGQRHPD